MSTETETPAVTDAAFGRISRRKGRIFRWVLLLASFAGIVSLGVLLVYVVVDAVEPLTADALWYPVFFVTVVAPVAGVGLFYRRSAPAAGRLGFAMLGVPVLSLMAVAATFVVLADVIGSTTWFGFVVALAAATGLYVGFVELRPDSSFETRFVVGAALYWFALVGIPSVPIPFTNLATVEVIPGLMAAVTSLPYVPTQWAAFFWTLVVPVGIGVALYLGDHRSGRTALVAGGLVVGGGLAGGAGAFLVGFSVAVGELVTVGTVVPFALLIEHARRDEAVDRRDLRAGLALPVAVIGGLALNAILTRVLGLAGPESWIDWAYLTNAHSRFAEGAGIYPALVGSVLIMIIVVLLTFPIGVGAAVYLEEYASASRFARLVRINISNLAGVPSVVYGLLGLGLFIRVLDMGLGSILVAGMTLSLLILPIVIISSREAIRAVPDSMRQASYGMGATRWQTVRRVVLPEAMPGILTGTILALARAVGEAAPLLMIGTATTAFSVPSSFTDTASAMPLQIYAWSEFPSEAFQHGVVAAGVVVLVVVMLTMNSVAIVLRNRYETRGES
ncbi:MAG: phosphate ABC transporter permease PstA [Halobacteriales archaeon]